MIRRRAEGEFWLIDQDDHAALSGELAARFGNELYATPTDRPRLARATALHDAGWPLQDRDAPTRNAAGLPLDVFEAGVEAGVALWEAGAARAEAADPYAGLLVSIHVQRLLAYAARTDPKKRPPLTNRQKFKLIEFTNDQAQRQAALREQLGLRSDRALDAGLPVPGGDGDDDPDEQRLAYDLRILQACDLLSLAACCDAPPVETVAPMPRRPGGPSLPLSLSRPTAGRLVVHPWPFEVATLVLNVPYRPVPQRPYGSDAALSAALAAAPRRNFQVVVEGRRLRL